MPARHRAGMDIYSDDLAVILARRLLAVIPDGPGRDEALAAVSALVRHVERPDDDDARLSLHAASEALRAVVDLTDYGIGGEVPGVEGQTVQAAAAIEGIRHLVARAVWRRPSWGDAAGLASIALATPADALAAQVLERAGVPERYRGIVATLCAEGLSYHHALEVARAIIDGQ